MSSLGYITPVALGRTARHQCCKSPGTVQTARPRAVCLSIAFCCTRHLRIKVLHAHSSQAKYGATQFPAADMSKLMLALARRGCTDFEMCRQPSLAIVCTSAVGPQSSAPANHRPRAATTSVPCSKNITADPNIMATHFLSQFSR